MLKKWLMIMAVLLVSGLALGATNLEDFMADYNQTESYLVGGLDYMPIGQMTADLAMGYPRSSIGVSGGFGISYRRYFNTPSEENVRKAASQVLAKDPTLEGVLLRNAINQALDQKFFPFWGLHTAVFVLPGAEIGVSYFLNPRLNINAGVFSNLGFMFVPVPWAGFQYRF